MNTETLEIAAAVITAIGGDVGGEAHIIDVDDGTDLTLKVPNHNWQRGTEEIGIQACGDIFTSSYDAEGCLVLKKGKDSFYNPLILAIEDTRLTIRENRIVKIEGMSDDGTQAKTFEKLLRDVDDHRAFNLAEFAVGINQLTPRVHGSTAARGLPDGIYIATGTNAICLKKTCSDISKFRSGRYDCGVRIGFIKFGVSVYFRPGSGPQKGKWVTIMKDGDLMV